MLRQLFHRLSRTVIRTTRYWGVALAVVLSAILLPQATHALSVHGVLAELLQAIVSGLGNLAIIITDTIVTIASYNGFINSPTVIYGWVLVRDMVNMVFVVILLIIAIATILPGLETYNYKKLLPKVIILAILVNFSRTICGLAIDAAQVVMLTFVAGFKDIGPGNMMAAVGLADLLSFSPDGVSAGEIKEDPTLSVVTIYLYAMLYLIVLILVLISMVVMLAYRIVMLWLLIVLSPLFYAMQAIPSAAGKASMWSGEFTKYLIAGPVLAFFIWLSMASFSGAGGLGQPGLGVTGSESTQVTTGIGESGSPNFLTNFIISMGLLVGGMTITAQMGVAGAKFGQNMLNKAKGIGLSAAKIATVGAAGLAAKGIWRGTKAAASNINQTLYAKTGRRIVSPVERYQAYKAHREEVQKQKKLAGDQKFAAKVEKLQEGGHQVRAALFRAGNSPQAHYQSLRDSNQGRVKNMYDAVKTGGMSKDAARDELTKIEQRKAALVRVAAPRNDRLKQVGLESLQEQLEYRVTKSHLTEGLSMDEAQKKHQGFKDKITGMSDDELIKHGKQEEEVRIKNSARELGVKDISADGVRREQEEVEADLAEARDNGDVDKEEQLKSRTTQLQQLRSMVDSRSGLKDSEREKEVADLEGKERRLRNFIAAPVTGESGAAAATAKAEALKKYGDRMADPNKLGEDLARAFANKAGSDIAVLLEKAMADGSMPTVLNKQGYEYSRDGVENFRKEMLVGKLGMNDQGSVNLLKSLGDVGANRSSNPDALLHAIYGYDKGRNVIKSSDDSDIARFDLLADRYKNQEMTLRNTAGSHLGATTPDGSKKMDAAGIDWVINARVQVQKTIENSQVSQGNRDWIIQNRQAILNELKRRKDTGEIKDNIGEVEKAINGLEQQLTKEQKRQAQMNLIDRMRRGNA